MTEDKSRAEASPVDVRCVQCRIPETVESLRLLRGAGWHQREDGGWLCPRCSKALARAS
jgi:hypothetical protein